MGETWAPRSIAIAGAWGYIGHKFIEAGLALGYDVFVYDPGPVPNDIDLSCITRVESESDIAS